MDVNREQHFPVNINSENKMNNEIFLKCEIKDEPMDDNEFFPANYADDTVDDAKEISLKNSKFDVGDSKLGIDMDINWKETGSATFKSTNEINKRMSLIPEIKNEPIDDNSLILTEYVDNTGSVTFNSTNEINERMPLISEIKNEPMDDDALFPVDSNSNVGDCKLGVATDINWKKIGSATFKSTNEINKRMSSKIEIKNELMNDHSLILPEYVNNTVNANCDVYKISCEDSKADNGRISGNLSNLRSAEVTKCFEENKSSISVKYEKHEKPIEKKYQCDLCEKSFSNSSNFKVHKRTHTGDTPYQCDVCEKLFSDRGNLNAHKRMHTGEKPYQCDVCEKFFSYSSNLNVHKRTHTGEKPHKCDVCEKSFGHASTLIKHKRTHTGEKPYQCDLCEKSFMRVGCFIIHKRMHSGEKPYKCEACKKCFSRLEHLKRHNCLHTGDKPY